jgi:O-acetyl-ADP-ribose deacetylase (regulator of RNase III)
MSSLEALLRLPGGRSFSLVLGNLLEEPSDAIVNAANGHLAHGGGVAAAIAKAAGPDLEREGRAYVREHGPVPTGEAVVTTAGRLPFKGVIHAVGPRLGEGQEEEALTRAVASALTRAHERGWSTVSFPAISSGIFAVPPEICARAYVAGVLRFFEEHPDTALEEVHLCLMPGPLPLVELVSRRMEEAEAGGLNRPAH